MSSPVRSTRRFLAATAVALALSPIAGVGIAVAQTPDTAPAATPSTLVAPPTTLAPQSGTQSAPGVGGPVPAPQMPMEGPGMSGADSRADRQMHRQGRQMDRSDGRHGRGRGRGRSVVWAGLVFLAGVLFAAVVAAIIACIVWLVRRSHHATGSAPALAASAPGAAATAVPHPGPVPPPPAGTTPAEPGTTVTGPTEPGPTVE